MLECILSRVVDFDRNRLLIPKVEACEAPILNSWIASLPPAASLLSIAASETMRLEPQCERRPLPITSVNDVALAVPPDLQSHGHDSSDNDGSSCSSITSSSSSSDSASSEGESASVTASNLPTSIGAISNINAFHFLSALAPTFRDKDCYDLPSALKP